MASGFKSGANDLDAIFDPYVKGTKPAATGLKVGAVDLADRYAPLSFGTKAPNVGITAGGVDVSNLWAALGTAVYDFPWHGQYYNALEISLTGGPGSVLAQLTITFNSDGTWTLLKSLNKGGGGGNTNTTVASGRGSRPDKARPIIKFNLRTRSRVLRACRKQTARSRTPR